MFLNEGATPRPGAYWMVLAGGEGEAELVLVSKEPNLLLIAGSEHPFDLRAVVNGGALFYALDEAPPRVDFEEAREMVVASTSLEDEEGEALEEDRLEREEMEPDDEGGGL